MAGHSASKAEVIRASTTMDRAPDWLDAHDLSALGSKPVLVLDAREGPPLVTQAVIIGIDFDARTNCSDVAQFDILLTSVEHAPAPWISVPKTGLSAQAEWLARSVRHTPFAATTLCRLLRITESLPFEDALACESLAYSTLLDGGEFARWLARRGAAPILPSGERLVRMERVDDHATITLDDPAGGNAMTARMRDALFEALCATLDDPSQPWVTIRAQGRWFSTGGLLAEFGTAPDLATAHVIRTVRNAARLIHALGQRAEVYIQGPAIGSGLELAAAAARRRATEHAWFHLPELAMGLVPGAGGTVTLPRAIGRHRTAWLALSGKRLRAREALAMGLLHSIDES